MRHFSLDLKLQRDPPDETASVDGSVSSTNVADAAVVGAEARINADIADKLRINRKGFVLNARGRKACNIKRISFTFDCRV